MELDEFIAKEKENYNSDITGYRLEGTIFEGGEIFDFIFNFEKPLKYKIQLKTAPDKVYREGFDGERAWELNSYVRGKEGKELENTAQWPNAIVSLADFRDRGHEITLHGITELNNQDLYEVELQLSSGHSQTYYYDTEEFLLRYSRDKRYLEPEDNKPTEMETVYKNYKEVDGCHFACHLMDRKVDEDDPLVDIQWEYVIVNPEFQDDAFERGAP